MDHKPCNALENELPWYMRLARERLLSYRTDSAGQGRLRHGRAGYGPWKRCAAAAGASLTFGAIADAAVQFISPPSPIRLEIPANVPGIDTHGLDLDSDGQPDLDFQVSVNQMTNTGTQITRRRARATRPFLGSSVVGSNLTAKQLFSGVPISTSATFVADAVVRSTRLYVTSGGSYVIPYGEWDTNSTGLLGVRFNIPGDGTPTTHFGWIRVKTDMGSTQTALEILNWAYQDIPNMAIIAGDEVGPIMVLGDYNKNLVVDSGDFDRWKSEFGRERFLGEGADGNFDGVVNSADYTVWRDNLGNTAESPATASSTSIPEPGTLSLGVLALGAAGVTALRKRRKC